MSTGIAIENDVPEPGSQAGSAAADIRRVVVVGGGIMGSGIAQVVAQAGLDVTLVDVDPSQLERAERRIDSSLERLSRSGRIDEPPADVRARIALSSELGSAAAGADHAIETVVEDAAVKAEVLRQLDASCPPATVLASNTSQFSISMLGAATSRPDRVIGSHWFNPPARMNLIEIISGVETSAASLATTLGLAEIYGKETVLCNKDTPGFITSRLIVALGLEAMRVVEEGIASVEDVDKACMLAFNHAMGPLATMDFSGLDTTLHVADAMREQYGERFLAPQNLRNLVNGGHLGRKSGRGFETYGETD